MGADKQDYQGRHSALRKSIALLADDCEGLRGYL